MVFHKSRIFYNSDRDIYWMTIVFEDNSSSKCTKVFIGATDEYFVLNSKSNEKLDKEVWFKRRLDYWLESVDYILNKKNHYDCFAMNELGRKNVLEFLQNLS